MEKEQNAPAIKKPEVFTTFSYHSQDHVLPERLSQLVNDYARDELTFDVLRGVVRKLALFFGQVGNENRGEKSKMQMDIIRLSHHPLIRELFYHLGIEDPDNFARDLWKRSAPEHCLAMHWYFCKMRQTLEFRGKILEILQKRGKQYT